MAETRLMCIPGDRPVNVPKRQPRRRAIIISNSMH